MIAFSVAFVAAVAALNRAPAVVVPCSDSLQPPPREVRYRNGDVDLAASLLMPCGRGPHPAAVMAQGSGSSSRKNAWAEAMARELVRRGVAVLFTDKRGSGASTGNWQRSDFFDLAGDAVAGVDFLRSQAGIDSSRIGLIGLSQGGWVVPVAAARSPHVAFVIDIVGASVTFAEQSFTEMANTAREAGLSEPEVREVVELNRLAAGYALGGDWMTYARARDRLLASRAKQIAAGFPASPDAPVWTFLRGVAAFDPLPYWLMVTKPVLVVFGELDEQDNVPVVESVRRFEHVFKIAGKSNYRVFVTPGVGHSLLTQDRTRFAPQFLGVMDEWLSTYVTRGR